MGRGMSMTLKESIKLELTPDGITIPELCRKFDREDEFDIMQVIAELQHSGEVFLNGFDTLYREDGGAIYLAKYSRNTAR